MPKMRAKMALLKIEQLGSQENLHFNAVAASKYPEDGSDENNSFAKFSPAASCVITVANPELIAKFSVGEQYYVDFTPA